MSKAKTEYKIVKLADILPDEMQPRKNFDASALSLLINSIKSQGIRQPLVVQSLKTGKYLLVDGERRFRAATELKLKEVPVIIEPETDDVTRVIQQFHIQEQHQGWTSPEKAMAIGQLSEQLEMNYGQIAELLAINSSTARAYKAFWDLKIRKEFEKSEVPIRFSTNIISATRRTKKLYEPAFEEKFDDALIRRFQLRVLTEIKSGNIRTASDLAKLIDVFTAEPDKIPVFIKAEQDIIKMYHDSNAADATTARHLKHSIVGIDDKLNKIMRNGKAFELFKSDINNVTDLKRIGDKVNKLIKLIG